MTCSDHQNNPRNKQKLCGSKQNIVIGAIYDRLLKVNSRLLSSVMKHILCASLALFDGAWLFCMLVQNLLVKSPNVPFILAREKRLCKSFFMLLLHFLYSRILHVSSLEKVSNLDLKTVVFM